MTNQTSMGLAHFKNMLANVDLLHRNNYFLMRKAEKIQIILELKQT